MKEDEFSIKEIYFKAKKIISYTFSKWLIIISVSFLALIIGYFIAWQKRPIYNGTITFVLSSESKNSGLGGLASQFGIDLGGGASSDIFSGDNIISLFKSRKMLRNVLFKKAPSTNEFLINILVTDLQLDLKWAKEIHTNGMYPFKSDTLTTPIQDSLINSLCKKINEDILTVIRVDRKLSIYELNTKSTNEIFACYLSRFLVDETKNFYINTKTSLAKQNLLMLQNEADSIKSLIGNSIASTASEVDRTFNLNPALQIQRTGVQKKQINSNVLGIAYGEVIKNLELAKINLQKETPLFQIIDIPSIPLEATKPSKLLYSILGFLIGFVLAIIIVSFIKLREHLK